MALMKYLRKEYGCMKDDRGVTLDFVKIDRTKEIFHYGSGEDKKSYNVKRDEMYDIKLKGLIFTKVIYFYNVNNPMPLNYSKTSESFEPIISPRLYNRMLENEILIKLNTLSSNINYKMLLIIAGLVILGYFAYQSGLFGSPDAVLNTTNMTNTTNTTGTFKDVGIHTIRTVTNTTPINITALKGVPV
jgi:hypothetical protein